MKIEDQVCSFEQSKKLFELGVNCAKNFIWMQCQHRIWLVETRHSFYSDDGLTKKYPAYTVAELGFLLPEIIRCGIKACYNLTLEKERQEAWWIVYEACGDRSNWYEQKSYQTEALARANALIWLIENGYINPKELKL